MSGRSAESMRAARRGARTPVLDAARPHGLGNLAEDLTGRQFGSLTVTQRAANSAAQKSRWVCRCACSRLRVALGSELRSGRVAACVVCAHVEVETEAPVVVPAPPPSQPRPAARMLPVYPETTAHRCDRTAKHDDRTAANAVALAWGVERRHECDGYSACLDRVPHAAVDARCPRECPGFLLDPAESREARLLAATSRVTFDSASQYPSTRGLAPGDG